MIDWGLVIDVIGGFFVTILVLAILLLVTWATGQIIRRFPVKGK